MTGNFYTSEMRACFLAVLFLTAISYGYAKSQYGETCDNDDECDSRLTCVPMATTTEEPMTTSTTEEPMTTSTAEASSGGTNADDLEPEDDDMFVPRRHLLSHEPLKANVVNGKCQCQDEYKLIDGKCRLELSEDLVCQDNIDCEVIRRAPFYDDGDVKGKCENNVCTCGDNWQVAMNESIPMCYKVPDPEDGGDDSDPAQYQCSANQECEFLYDNLRNTTSHCNNTVCVCDETWKIYTFSNKTEKTGTSVSFCARPLESACDNDEQCSHIEDSVCSNKKCACDDGYSGDGDFKCSSGSALVSSLFMLVSALWLTKESH